MTSPSLDGHGRLLGGGVDDVGEHRGQEGEAANGAIVRRSRHEHLSWSRFYGASKFPNPRGQSPIDILDTSEKYVAPVVYTGRCDD